ncbi:MAG: SRPBCC domain-containing protein [Candidatus Marinimicrobia bacterium]|nr:SRPBCC domain-containing protein [Candidatus Neomarinimicrobiota bacterium]MCF7903772.1 SRPBCC domain-containing protein [Candidatus Neomarinimicrobiota bacterium]
MDDHAITSQKILHKNRVIEAGKADVWKKWTTHAGLKTFIGSDNKIDLTPGGPFEIYFLMDAPVGEKGGEGNKVLSFLPNDMLSFSWNAPPSIPEIRNQKHRTWVVIQLIKMNETTTKVTLDHLGWKDGDKWDETYDYFDKAWDFVLNSLKKSV